MLQLGVLLFLLGLLVGSVVPALAVPRLGLSAHLLGVTEGTFLIVIGLLWPRLNLGPRTSRVGFWLAVYGCFAVWAPAVLGGVWGAGNVMMPIAAGQARGTAVQEGIIMAGLVTGAVAMVAVCVLILWGLRGPTHEGESK